MVLCTCERWLGRAALLFVLLFLLAATYTNLREPSALLLITSSTTLANNAGSITGAQTNTLKYMLADIEFVGPDWSAAPSANGAISIWICSEVDATNFEDCDTTNFSPRVPDVVFGLRAADVPQRLIRRHVLMPSGDYKVLLKNESGVTLTGTAPLPWTLKIRAATPQSS